MEDMDQTNPLGYPCPCTRKLNVRYTDPNLLIQALDEINDLDYDIIPIEDDWPPVYKAPPKKDTTWRRPANLQMPKPLGR